MNRALSLLLAAGAGLLAACQEPKSPPVVQGGALLPDSAEQLMLGVRFKLTDAGVQRAELEADTALVYGQGTRFELRRVKTIFYTMTGERDATLTSLEGTYHVRVQSMEARGNVVVVSTDGKKLETPQLKYDPTRNEVSSDSAFVLTEPDGVSSGIGFVSDPDMTQVRVLRAARTTGRNVTIPKR
jgi:LPS export ABC transporter protein LptC